MPVSAKRRTNLTLDAGLLDRARALGLNVSAISEAALAEALRHAEADAWKQENAQALARRRAWIDAEGPPLAKWQAWTPD